ncbi:Os01g0627450 [Oryza sativa Japonica Group]|uniref:Os01g0627450 protein n=1 Tax=Oryza sativa subsp. japonica TaxID=39947 RepID=A0A0P0V5H9_ORYSJ|nr:hypothetical protein EE612_004475 [Oryza sativa]BAS73260.1 Os01g0627450 [Oryza sativa Japonica Group]
MPSATLASSSAKFWPMQMRGPQLNGKNAPAPGSLHALATPSANLPGSNSPASCPHAAASRWMNSTGSDSITPAGYLTPPSSISLYVRRFIITTGGYRRSTSCSTMVTCQRSAPSIIKSFVSPKDLQNLLPGAILPLRVHAQGNHCPGEQHGGCLHPGEVEQLAFVDDLLDGHPLAGFAVLVAVIIHVGL